VLDQIIIGQGWISFTGRLLDVSIEFYGNRCLNVRFASYAPPPYMKTSLLHATGPGTPGTRSKKELWISILRTSKIAMSYHAMLFANAMPIYQMCVFTLPAIQQNPRNEANIISLSQKSSSPLPNHGLLTQLLKKATQIFLFNLNHTGLETIHADPGPRLAHDFLKCVAEAVSACASVFILVFVV